MKKLVENAGACVVSNNILKEIGNLKWCVREKSINEIDNGWRFFSDIDNEDYLKDSKNLSVCDFNSVAEIEPAILGIYDLPKGSDLELMIENGKRYFINSLTGDVIN